MYAYPNAQLPGDEQISLAVEVFAMLADPTRIGLLWLLRDGEAPVMQLAGQVGKAQSAVSQHLAKLRLARLVTTRRQGSQVFYALTDEHVRQLVVDAIHHAEHVGPGAPAHHALQPTAKAATTG